MIYKCQRCVMGDWIWHGQHKRCVYCDIESNWHITFPPKSALQLTCEDSVGKTITAEEQWLPPWLDELI